MMYLFFDTETTGLPQNWKAPVQQVNNWPRLVQIAWLMYDVQGNLLKEQQYIIKPNGFTIPKAASNVHGITTEKAIQEGIELTTVLNEFNQDINQADALVAHNMSFDEKIVGAEFIRGAYQTALFKRPRLCTMLATVDFCKIPGRYGFKWPKLSELHIKLFGKDFDDAHDALVDIQATAKCFWELKQLGVISS
ncbi:MAG: exonuclease domain-containing protein [Flammeovirgaceae bacterium]